MSTSPFIGGRHDDPRPTSFAASLRRVDSPAVLLGATPFRPDGPIAGTGTVDAGARQAELLADLEARRAGAVAEGQAAGLAETDRLRALLAKVAEQFAAERAAMTQADASTVVDLALEVAAALLGRALATDRAALTRTVAEALVAGDTSVGTLRVHPGDAAHVAAELPAGIKLEVDATLAPGDVCLETDRSVVDGTAATRLAALREPLIAALEDPC